MFSGLMSLYDSLFIFLSYIFYTSFLFQPKYQEEPFAHVDFYPNGGYDQLCKEEACPKRRSHIHGIYYFNESITAKNKPLDDRFMSWRCGSSKDWDIFKQVNLLLSDDDYNL